MVRTLFAESRSAMAATVLYSENVYPDDSVERRIYGPDVRVIFPRTTSAWPTCRTRIAPRPKG